MFLLACYYCNLTTSNHTVRYCGFNYYYNLFNGCKIILNVLNIICSESNKSGTLFKDEIRN